MPWIGVALALVGALATAACTAAILRRLPLPVDEPDARPYADLVSPRLFAIVAASCLAALATSFLLAPWQTWPAWGALGTLGVLLAVVDAHTGLLPLRLTWAFGALVVLGLVAVAALRADPTPVWVAVLCGAGVGLLFWLLWRIGAGLGFGDVRLATLVAAVAGATSLQLAVWAFLLGGLAGVVWGVAVRLRRRDPADSAFPYGPSLVLGPYLALLAEWGLATAGVS